MYESQKQHCQQRQSGRNYFNSWNSQLILSLNNISLLIRRAVLLKCILAPEKNKPSSFRKRLFTPK